MPALKLWEAALRLSWLSPKASAFTRWERAGLFAIGNEWRRATTPNASRTMAS